MFFLFPLPLLCSVSDGKQQAPLDIGIWYTCAATYMHVHTILVFIKFSGSSQAIFTLVLLLLIAAGLRSLFGSAGGYT